MTNIIYTYAILCYIYTIFLDDYKAPLNFHKWHYINVILLFIYYYQKVFPKKGRRLYIKMFFILPLDPEVSTQEEVLYIK